MKGVLTQPQLEALKRLKETGMLGAKAMTKRALRSRGLIRWVGDLSGLLLSRSCCP